MIRFENVVLPGEAAGPVSFGLPAGGFAWVTGAAGAGKTRLLAVASGAARPASGRVAVLGIVPHGGDRRALASLRRRMGVVAEAPQLHPALTARDNILLPLRLRGVRAREAARDADAMAEWLGLARLDRFPAALSRGEQRLCAVARAVVGRPELLVADDPASGLGEREGGRVILLLAELNRLGTTVLVATRDAWARALHPGATLHLARGALARIEAQT